MKIKGLVISFLCITSFCVQGQALKIESALHYLNSANQPKSNLTKSHFVEEKKPALFCRLDNYFDARSKIPLRLRLGGLETVNKLEYDTDYRTFEFSTK